MNYSNNLGMGQFIDPTWIDAAQKIAQDVPQSTIQTYTPGSDLAAGFRQNELDVGRQGNNNFIGLNPVEPNPNQPNIDVFFVNLPILQSPTPHDYSNTFILGDWKQPYYVTPGVNGVGNGFAVILQFNPTQDFIQLHGTSADYKLVQSLAGTEIFWQQGNSSELIGLLPFSYGLSLDGNYFKYQGDTPATGPVLGQITQFGNGNFNISDGVATDPSGNVYVAGGTTGSLAGPNAGSRDAFVIKYDSNGNQVWSRQFGTSSFDTATSVATDKQDNVYLSGSTEGDLGGPKQGSSSDAWVAKYDSNGNRVWIQQFGTDIINGANHSAVDKDGNVYLSGTTVKADESGGIVGKDDYWVTKYDTNGNRQWFTEFGSTVNPNYGLNFSEAYSLALDQNANVYTTGWTLGDLGGVNAGLYDVWIAKQDTNGNREWIKQFGSTDYEWSWGVDTDSKNNVYATGWTLGNLGGVSTGSYDAWLTKYDTNGNQQWIKQFGTNGDTRGDTEATGLKVDSHDNIFLTGFTNGNLAGTNTESFDAWVAEYDSKGNQKWIKQLGTPKTDYAYAITVDKAEHVYVTGVTEGSLGGTNSGSFDGWVAKLDANSGTLENFNSTPVPVNPTDGRPFANRDSLTTTNNNDQIVSLPGHNTITAAGGSDTFTYKSYKGGNDIINNFVAANDRIDLSQIFGSPNCSSKTSFNDCVKLIQLGSNTAVEIKPTGDSQDIFKTLVTLKNVTATDLSASNFVV